MSYCTSVTDPLPTPSEIMSSEFASSQSVNVVDDFDTYIDTLDKLRTDDFGKMNLNDEVLRGIYNYGIEKASLPQTSIPIILKDDGCYENILLNASTGSGKTLTFLTAMVQIVSNLKNYKEPQVIIMTPTREVAKQIYEVALAVFATTGITFALHRGTSYNDGNGGITSDGYNYLSSGLYDGKEQIIICTPARLNSLIINPDKSKTDSRLNNKPCNVSCSQGRKSININVSAVHQIVFDECDKLLNDAGRDGMFKQIQITLEHLNLEICRHLLVSATTQGSHIQAHLIDLEKMYNRPVIPLDAIVARKSKKSVAHHYVSLNEESEKCETMVDIISTMTDANTVMIFTNATKKIEIIYNALIEAKIPSDFIHGCRSQTARDNAITKLRNGSIRCLVCTDLAARGIDITHLNLVINYDLPLDEGTYIHRAGRAGRFDKSGYCISFVVCKDSAVPIEVSNLEKYHNINISYLPKFN